MLSINNQPGEYFRSDDIISLTRLLLLFPPFFQQEYHQFAKRFIRCPLNKMSHINQALGRSLLSERVLKSHHRDGMVVIVLAIIVASDRRSPVPAGDLRRRSGQSLARKTKWSWFIHPTNWPQTNVMWSVGLALGPKGFGLTPARHCPCLGLVLCA